MDQLTPTEAEGSSALAEPASQLASWPTVAGLPTAVLVAVPIPEFRVRDLLALKSGSILSSAWRGEREVPLLADDVQFAWAEFEVTDEKLGVRVTRLK
jgi:flagellar motor switch/type III secretory pathway protein FliN